MNRPGGRMASDTGFRKDVDAIKDDIALLKTDLGTAMRDLIDAGRDGAGDARKRLQEIVNDRLESLNSAAEALSDRGRKMYRDVRTHVEEHPAQTIGIAVAVGAAIGLLFFAMKRR